MVDALHKRRYAIAIWLLTVFWSMYLGSFMYHDWMTFLKGFASGFVFVALGWFWITLPAKEKKPKKKEEKKDDKKQEKK